MDKIFLVLIMLIFVSCENYFIAESSWTLESVKKTIVKLDYEIVKVDTFWNLQGDSILRYRITYR